MYKQQLYLCNLLSGELNFVIQDFSLDIALINEKIYVEYNGGGHDLSVKIGVKSEEEFKQSEIVRHQVLKKEGWKQIKIISRKDLLPTDEVIVERINQAKKYLQQGHSWIELNIDKSLLKGSSGYRVQIDLGGLRTITK